MKSERGCIIVIGSARSGTTALARMLGWHSQVKALPELRYIWSIGAQWKRHDLRLPGEWKQDDVNKIRKYFARISYGYPQKILLDKTPSNCYRIPLCREVFPDARFVHIVRDGRAAAVSSLRQSYGGMPNVPNNKSGKSLLLRDQLLKIPRRIHAGELPVRAWAPYAWKRLVDLFHHYDTHGPPVWGGRYPGVFEHRKVYSPLEIAGIQWRESVTAALYGLKEYVAPEMRHEIRYEDLAANPVGTIKEVLDFLDLPVEKDILKRSAKEIRPSQCWRMELEASELSLLMRHIEPLLSHIGYYS